MKLYHSHPTLFWLILSLITTDFMIGVLSFFFGAKTNTYAYYFITIFILLGLVGYFALFTNNRKLLILKLSVGIAYDFYWAFIFGISPFFSTRARDLIWVAPLWFNLAILHVVAIMEPPRNPLTDDGK